MPTKKEQEEWENQFKPYVIEAAAENKIRPELADAIIRTESGYNPNAVSPKGAVGLAQIMPKYHPEANVNDPVENVRYGMKFFRENLDAFGGDEAKAAAAYNAGAGRVGRLLRRHGEEKWQDYLPEETKGYLNKLGLTGQRQQQEQPQAVTGQDQETPSIQKPETKPDYAALISRLDKAISEREYQENPTILRSAGRGLVHGLAGIPESVGTAMEYLGNRLDSNGLKDVGQTTSKFWGDIAKEYEAPEAFAGKNIIDNPELLKKGSWWAYNVMDMVPSLAASFGPSLGVYGVMSKGPAAIQALAKLGAAITGGVTGGGIEAAQTYKTIIDEGGSEAEAARAAEAMFLAAGALNSIGNVTFLRTAGKGFLNRAAHLGISGAVEGFTEGLEEPAEFASKMLSKYINGEKIPDDVGKLFIDSLKDAATVAPIAAVTGVGGGAVSQISENNARNKAIQDIDAGISNGQVNTDTLMNLKDNPDIQDLGLVDEVNKRILSLKAQEGGLPPTTLTDFVPGSGGTVEDIQGPTRKEAKPSPSVTVEGKPIPDMGPTNLEQLRGILYGKDVRVTEPIPKEPTEEVKTEEPQAPEFQNPAEMVSLTGRKLSPYPEKPIEGRMAQSRLNKTDEWLINEAIAEAESKGDDYNATIFKGELPIKKDGLPQASRDSANMYLFGREEVKFQRPGEEPLPEKKLGEIEGAKEPTEAPAEKAKEPWELPVKDTELPSYLHRAYVKKAVEEGKPVPREVLEDYVGLEGEGYAPWAEAALSKMQRKEKPKEPWEMTRDEFFKQAEKKLLTKTPGYYGPEWNTELVENRKKEFAQNAAVVHRERIQEAIDIGKPIPAEVLAEYPDLVQKEPKKFEAPIQALESPQKRWDDFVGSLTPNQQADAGGLLVKNPRNVDAQIKAIQERIGKPSEKGAIPEHWEKVPGSNALKSTFGNYLVSGEPGKYRLSDEKTGRVIGGIYTDITTATNRASDDWIKQKPQEKPGETEEIVPYDDWRTNIVKSRDYAKRLGIQRPEIWNDLELLVKAIDNKLAGKEDLKILGPAYVAPDKEQTEYPGKKVAKLLHSQGLQEKIFQGEDFHVKLKNEPYIDLDVERHTYDGPKETGFQGKDAIYLTHYIEEGGDQIIDSEMVFGVGEGGKLTLIETASRGPNGEFRTYRGTRVWNRRGAADFGNVFARNLIRQGWEKAKPEAKDVEVKVTPEPTAPLATPAKIPTAVRKLTSKEQKNYLIGEIDKAIETAPLKIEKEENTYVSIEIPGDGKFSILNDKETLTQVKKMAESQWKTGKPSSIITGFPKKEISDRIQQAIELYGHPQKAADTLQRQMDRLEDLTEKERKDLNVLIGGLITEANRRKRSIGTPENINITGLADRFLDRLKKDTGEELNKVKLQQIIADELGISRSELINNPKYSHKPVEEAFEYAIVLRTKEIIADGKSREQIYNDLKRLYLSQPNLGTRTSTSIENQAYSTPNHFGYLLQEFAGVGPRTRNYEPTAGTGMLVTEGNPDLTWTNELNDDRVKILKDQGFEVTQLDAINAIPDTTVGYSPYDHPIPKSFDTVTANPPFGSISTREIEGYKIEKLEHAIVMNALKAMKDDGKAAFIIGGHNFDANDGGMIGNQRIFLNWLYHNYNVVANIDIPGAEYARQGTKFDVRLIVVHGRKTQPAGVAPKNKSDYLSVNSIDELLPILKEVESGKQGLATGRTEAVSTGEGATGVASTSGRKPGGREELSTVLPEETTPTGPEEERRPISRPGQPSAEGVRAGEGTAGTTGGENVPRPSVATPTERHGAVSKEEDKHKGVAKEPEAGAGAEAVRPGVQEGAGGTNLKGVSGTGNDIINNLLSVFDEATEKQEVKPTEERPQTKEEMLAELSDFFKHERRPRTPTAQQKLQETKDYTKKIAEGAKKINELLGEKGSISWDKIPDNDNVWQQIKQILRDMLDATIAAGKSAAEFAKLAAKELGAKARPYFEKFLRTEPEFTGERKEPPKEAEETEFQVNYSPKSKGPVIDETLIPKKMKESIEQALNKLEKDVGDIDEYVKEKLKYSSIDKMHKFLAADQVDATALAIFNIERGFGMVIGDQTGVGKGRVAAAIVRYAHLNKDKPVFFTEKPNLFTDFYRDIVDIGHDFNPYIMVSNEKLGTIYDQEGNIVFTPLPVRQRGRIINAIRTHGKAGLADYNTVLTNYSQINKMNSRVEALNILTNGSQMILDESHNASGESTTGGYIRAMLENVKGVLYMSATFAKRPDTMPLYYKTAMSRANMTMPGLINAMETGGTPLQEWVSSALAKLGQYIRREKSFKGIDVYTHVNTSTRTEDEVKSDQMTDILRDIIRFDGLVGDFVNNLQGDIDSGVIDVLPGGVEVPDAIVDAGQRVTASVTTSNFASVVHNAVRQLLLSMKSQLAADRAIAELKAGRKPVIALANTMGSFLEDQIAHGHINEGDTLNMTYADVCERHLRRTLVYTVTDPQGNKTTAEIPLAELPANLQSEYNRVVEKIKNASTDLPGSPIDYIKAEILRAGYTIDEITGRNFVADLSDPNNPIVKRRTSTERANRNKIIKGFNDGQIDALIINAAGATGLSIHAAPKAGDKRPRTYIGVQGELNIDTEVQKMGRINRKGQVVLPSFQMLQLDIPTEIRPASVMMKKMKSLSANTSANSDSPLATKNLPDMLNRYGNRIAREWLDNHPEIAHNLHIAEDAPDIMMKLTGRIAIQPVRVQREFFEEVEEEYNNLISNMKEEGTYDLIVEEIDLKAKTENKDLIVGGQDESNPFGQSTWMERVRVKLLRKPYKRDRIVELVNNNLEGKSGEEFSEDLLTNIKNRTEFYINEKSTEAIDNDQDFTDQENRIRGQLNTVENRLSDYTIGETYNIYRDNTRTTGVLIDIKYQSKAGSPTSPSKIRFVFAVASPAQRITIPLSSIMSGNYDIFNQSHDIIEDWDGLLPTETTEFRHIITGNLLQGFSSAPPQSKIIRFTTEDGGIREGILTPRGFNPARQADEIIVNKAQAKDILNAGYSLLGTESGVLIDNIAYRQNFEVRTPRSRTAGGKYYLDDELKSLTVQGEFESSGQSMKATVEKVNIQNYLDRMFTLGATFKINRSDFDKIFPSESQPTIRGESVRETVPTFYSQMERVLDKKLPNAGTPRQFRQMIKSWADKGEFKNDEWKWSGVDDWLNEKIIRHKEAAEKNWAQTDWKITKQEVLDFLKANEVQIKEVTKGEPLKELTDEEFDRYDQLNTKAINDRGLFSLSNLTEAERTEFYSLRERHSAGPEMDTKFSQWQLPGGENYRELLLTLPDKYKGRSSEQIIENINRELGQPLRAPVPSRSNALVNTEFKGQRDKINALYDELDTYWNSYSKEGKQQFIGRHWSEPNVLAHVRFNDRYTSADGTPYTPPEKTLFIEEVQSDWHQAGRKKGYQEPGTRRTAGEATPKDGYYEVNDNNGNFLTNVYMNAAVKTPQDAIAEANRRLREQPGSVSKEGAVPPAPFAKTWHELVLKRMLRYAAENGYDRVAWTTGEQQAERYDLSKHISSLEAFANNDKTYNIFANDLQGGRAIEKFAVPEAQLPDIVGKELAEKIVNAPYRRSEFKGLDLKVGGEGMKGFYDKIIPDYLNKYAKKWGAKTEPINISVLGTNEFGENIDESLTPTKTQQVWSLPVTESMRESVLTQGQVMFQAGKGIVRGLPKATVEKEVAEITKDLKGAPAYEVYQSQKDFPQKWTELVEKYMQPGQYRGFFVTDGKGNTTIIFVADNIKDVAAIHDVFGHEVIGHFGPRVVLKEDEYNAWLDDVYNSQYRADIDKGAKDPAYKYKVETPSGRRKATEEWFARHIKEVDPLKDSAFKRLWDNLVEMVRKALVRMGIKVQITDSEIRNMIRKSWEVVKKGEGVQAIGQEGVVSGQSGITSSKPTDLLPVIKSLQSPGQDRELVSISKLRDKAGMEPEAFDKALLKLAQENKVALHQHDFPSSLKESERKKLLSVPNPNAYWGGRDYYVGVVPKVEPARQTADVSGQQVTPSDVNTPEFKKWFGKSKVVDEKSGKPLIVYHGTTADPFEAFNKSQLGDAHGHATGLFGFAFTTNQQVAGYFSGTEEPGARIIPAYLSIQRPYEMSSSDFYKHFVDKGGYLSLSIETDAERKVRRVLSRIKAKGYDGIHVYSDSFSHWLQAPSGEYQSDVWFAFEPTQIKSIFNRGTWDKGVADISGQSITDYARSLGSKPGPVQKGLDYIASIHQAMREAKWKPGGLVDLLVTTPEWSGHPVEKEVFQATQERERNKHTIFYNIDHDEKTDKNTWEVLKTLKNEGVNLLRRIRGRDLYDRDNPNVSDPYRKVWDVIDYMDVNRIPWNDTPKEQIADPSYRETTNNWEAVVLDRGKFDEKGMDGSDFKTWRQRNTARDRGVTFLVGKVNGKERTHLVRLSKDYFETLDDAKAWFDDNRARLAGMEGYRKQLERENVPQKIIDTINAFRTSMEKSLEHMRATTKEVIDAYEKAGRDLPVLFIDHDEKGKETKYTLVDAYEEMGSHAGYYAPRIRETGDWVVLSTKDDQPYRYHTQSRRKAIHLERQLRRDGHTDLKHFEDTRSLPETVYEDLTIGEVAKALESAVGGMKDVDPALQAKFRIEVITAASDMLKARAFRSHRIARLTDQVVKGYIEDPLTRHILYSSQIAGGIAKGTAATKMFNAYLGVWKKYERNDEDNTWELKAEDGTVLDTRNMTEKEIDSKAKTTSFRYGGLDPAKDKELHAKIKNYIANQLRNPDKYERWVGLGKSIVSFKYLGFNPRSMMVNTTAMLQTVPPAIHQYVLEGKGSMKDIFGAVARASRDYIRVMRGKPLANSEEQAFMDEIIKHGYDAPQYMHDALGSIHDLYGGLWSNIMGAAMKPFALSEQWNRGSTMLAAYRLAKENGKSHEEAMKLAETASNKAHGIYGQATLPAWAQGQGPVAMIGRMGYTYQKFAHNYLQMLADLGFKQKNFKALAFALAAPTVLGGAKASIAYAGAMAFINALLSALGYDDPEKFVYDTIREEMGDYPEQITRYGLFGALGFEVSSSMAVGMEVPRSLMDLTGPFGGFLEGLGQSWHFLDVGQPYRAIEGLAPNVVKNVLQGIREAKTGAVTRTGKPVWDEAGEQYMPSAAETGWKVAGFRGARRAAVQEREMEAKRSEARYSEQRDEIYERYRAYINSGMEDQDELDGILEDVQKYNSRILDKDLVGIIAPISAQSLKRQIRRMSRPSRAEYLRRQQEAQVD